MSSAKAGGEAGEKEGAGTVNVGKEDRVKKRRRREKRRRSEKSSRTGLLGWLGGWKVDEPFAAVSEEVSEGDGDVGAGEELISREGGDSEGGFKPLSELDSSPITKRKGVVMEPSIRLYSDVGETASRMGPVNRQASRGPVVESPVFNSSSTERIPEDEGDLSGESIQGQLEETNDVREVDGGGVVGVAEAWAHSLRRKADVVARSNGKMPGEGDEGEESQRHEKTSVEGASLNTRASEANRSEGVEAGAGVEAEAGEVDESEEDEPADEKRVLPWLVSGLLMLLVSGAVATMMNLNGEDDSVVHKKNAEALENLGIALHLHAEANRGELPFSLDELEEEGKGVEFLGWRSEGPGTLQPFVYFGGHTSDAHGATVIAAAPRPYDDGKRAVLFLDATVEHLPENVFLQRLQQGSIGAISGGTR